MKKSSSLSTACKNRIILLNQVTKIWHIEKEEKENSSSRRFKWKIPFRQTWKTKNSKKKKSSHSCMNTTSPNNLNLNHFIFSLWNGTHRIWMLSASSMNMMRNEITIDTKFFFFAFRHWMIHKRCMRTIFRKAEHSKWISLEVSGSR